MDTGDRLAAYLSGDLDPDERSALEADLAGDADLRARLERVRAADDALASLGDVELPDGFEDRLAARLRPELDAVLGDELARRRARRTTPRWLPAVGAAAALAVVVAGGLSISGGLGGDDMAADTAGGDDEGRVTLESGGDAATGMAETGLAPQDGPVVVDRNRSFDRDDLGELTRDPDVQAAIAADALLVAPAEAALPYARALGLPSDAPTDDDLFEGDGEDAGSRTETEAQDSVTASFPAPVVSDRGTVSDDDRAAVAACLTVLFEDAAAPVVPVYVELGTDEDGDEVIVYVALAPDADGEYRRLEVWMVDRETCTPQLFLQDQAQPADPDAP